eukprot:SM000051S17625  [mRNA]  locus=s51:642675:644994:- [translate_table: standard]
MAFAPRPAAAFSPRRSGQAAPLLANARVLWLRPAAGDPVMLLEDRDTGDVLLPLVYMKVRRPPASGAPLPEGLLAVASVFAANYSRKLSSLKHRLVLCKQPAASEAGVPAAGRISSKDFLYWTWAFEAPHEVKVLARQALGDEQAPQGHLRLILRTCGCLICSCWHVLLPIVYSAKAQKKALRDMPFFHALHHAMRASAYYRLVELLPTSVQAEVDLADKAQAEEQSLLQGTALSLGPFRTCRQGAEKPAAPLMACGQSADCTQGESVTFNGPHDLAKTLDKYTLSYARAEGSDHNISKHVRQAFTAMPAYEHMKSPHVNEEQEHVDGHPTTGSPECAPETPVRLSKLPLPVSGMPMQHAYTTSTAASRAQWHRKRPSSPVQATNCHVQRCVIMEEQELEKEAIDVDEEIRIKRYRGIVSLHREQTSDAELPGHIRIPKFKLNRESLKLNKQSLQEVDVDERLQAMQRRMQQLVNGALSEVRLLFRYARHNAQNRHD